MLDNRKKRILIYSSAIIFILLIFLLAGPPKLLESSSSPEFCNLCHPMNDQYEPWFLTGLHRNIKCVDCHLPNDNIFNHFLWKGLDGTKDLALFVTGFYTENITATNHARGVIKDNCMRCHDEMVSRMETSERDCWSCHRRISHRIIDLSVRN